MQEDDLELLRRWRDGDRTAGDLLFERHFDGLYRFFGAKVSTDVEDLIQQTVMACLEKRDRIESFRAYLYGVARYVLFEYYRGRSRGGIDLGEVSLEDLSPGPSLLVAEDHEARLLTSALRRIPLELQIVLELHYWEKMSHRELAEALSLSIGAVKGKIAAGRKAVKSWLERLEEGRGFNALSTMDLDQWVSSLRGARDRPVTQDRS